MAAAGPASAQMDMFGDESPPFTHGSGLYAFKPPAGWMCAQLKDSSVECRTNSGGAQALATITHLTIQGQLDSELMAFNTEQQLKKLPHYRKTGGGRLLLGGLKASIRSFTFDYQGNTELPVAVEELYVVSGGKAVRFHFETMMAAMPSYGRDLKQFYDTLGLAEVDELGQIIQPAQARDKQRAQKEKQRREGRKSGGLGEMP